VETSGKLSKELADTKEEIEQFEKLQKDFADLQELAKLSESDEDAKEELPAQLSSFQKRVEKQEIHIFLSGKYDRTNAILTITAGAGGQDAQDWATILFRMYERYCDSKGWRGEIVHQSFGEQGSEGRVGTKQVSLEVVGTYAYGLLRREVGIHRLVRISPFSAKQLRHTSFAAVEVLPEVNLKEEKDILGRFVSGQDRNPWASYFERHNVDHAIVKYQGPTIKFADRGPPFPSNVLNIMFNRKKWALVHFDDTALLFLKRGPEFRDIINQHEYKNLWPYNTAQMSYLLKNNVISKMDVEKELNRHIKDAGRTYRAGTMHRLIHP